MDAVRPLSWRGKTKRSGAAAEAEGGDAKREIQARAALQHIQDDAAQATGTFRPILTCDCNADAAYPEKDPPVLNPDPAIAALQERF